MNTNSCKNQNEQKVGIPGVSVVKNLPAQVVDNLPAQVVDIDQGLIPDPGRFHKLRSN